MTRAWRWALGGVLVAAAAGLAAPRWLPLLHAATPEAPAAAGGKERRKDGGKDGGERPPQKVDTVLVAPQAFTETLTATGSLLADESVELQAEIAGKVAAIRFEEGARVRRGELLVKLNDAELRAQREQARHQLELAELREQRIARLVREGIVTESDYDTARYEVAARRDQIAIIDAQIDRTEVRAPFDGIVGLRHVSEGSYVNASTRVATLQQVDRLKVSFSVPEKYAGRIRIGSPIRFAIVGSEHRHRGVIYAYDPRIDAGTRTLVIRARSDHGGGSLLPGAFANVELELDRLDDAILVPAEAVIPGVSDKNVFVIADGKAERRPVEIGTRTASQVQILSGLKPGDRLIVSGLQQLRAGLAVVDAGHRDDAAARREAGTGKRRS